MSASLPQAPAVLYYFLWLWVVVVIIINRRQTNKLTMNPTFADNDNALINHIRHVMIENGDYKQLQQRFLSELVLSNRNSCLESGSVGIETTGNGVDNGFIIGNDQTMKQTWMDTILHGLRLEKDKDAISITLDELKEIVITLGKDSIPNEVQSKMMGIIRSNIESMELHY